MNVTSDFLKSIIDLHFDPKWGAPYWIEKANALPFNPRTDIHTINDLEKLGEMPLSELAIRPFTDFLPIKFHKRHSELITSETGGATGPPKRTVFFREEFEWAFVNPFLEAARLVGFPRHVNWLYVGPTGPHAIGKGARECAVRTGSVDPFMVDFDPRWVRKLPEESLARRRYLEHVIDQAIAILKIEAVSVLFSTPPVLEELGRRVPVQIREQILGVHLGGMSGDEEFWNRLRSEWYPNAVFMSGYGNSLAGVCPQVEDTPGKKPAYFPFQSRLILDIHDPDESGRGRVKFHRLDQSCFLPNVIERDVAIATAAPKAAAEAGFQPIGIANPQPAESLPSSAQTGLY